MEEELNAKWDIHRTIQEAIRTAHTEPSPETKERLTQIELTLKEIIEILRELIKQKNDE